MMGWFPENLLGWSFNHSTPVQQLHRCRTYRKVDSMRVNRIIEGLNDSMSLQSELITSVSSANKSVAALPR